MIKLKGGHQDWALIHYYQCPYKKEKFGHTHVLRTDFVCVEVGGVSKITADGDCSHEIQKHLLLGKKAITNIDSAETSLCQQKSMQSKLWFFQQSCTDMRVGPERKLSAEELMFLNCGAGEDS